MERVWMILRAVAAVSVVGGVCILGVVNALFGRREAVATFIQRTACRLVLRSCGAPVTVVGAENVPAEGGFVLISNHESHLDGPFLLGWFPRPFTIVAKRELFRIPIMGAGFRAFGFVEVNRADHAQSVASMDGATAHLREGGGVLVFSEGHRTKTGEFQPFKKGAFVQAIKAQVPLVPVGLAGTRAVLPHGSGHIRPGPVRMIIGPPIPVEGKTLDDRDALLEEAHAIVARLRAEAQATLHTADTQAA